MIEMERTPIRQRFWRPLWGWLRAHAVALLRFTAILALLAVTVIAGYRCYGLVGPPG